MYEAREYLHFYDGINFLTISLFVFVKKLKGEKRRDRKCVENVGKITDS